MRPKSTNKDLPPRLLCRTRVLSKGVVRVRYYYNGRDEAGKRLEIFLGTDLHEAKRKWAELERQEKTPADSTLLRSIFDRYEKEIIPTKAFRTQKDNLFYLSWLRKVFDTAPIELVTPQHIAQYRDKRGQTAPVRANREIALLSHIWNSAREWGLTTKENPVKGVRKNKETPRDYYADDQVWNAVYSVACTELKDAMDLNYLTGQRPADVLKMRVTDIKDGALEVTQNKTKKKLRITIKGDLKITLERIKSRGINSVYLVATPTGSGLNQGTLRLRFDNARLIAEHRALELGDEHLATKIKGFQFRDIRPKAASEMTLEHASKLLGHTEQEITEKVYRRVGETVDPTK